MKTKNLIFISTFLIFILLGINCLAQTQNSIILQGQYNNKNLYVQNPIGPLGFGYCVTHVKVNDLLTTDQVLSSAFEIDLSNCDLQHGENVEIQIFYTSGCGPNVLNPEVLQPKSTFEIVNISVDDVGLLSWTTVGEHGALTYVIEQYRWNKWIKIGEVDGNGKPRQTSYSYQTVLHSGTNEFRIYQVDGANNKRYSSITRLDNSKDLEVEIIDRKIKNKLTFSRTTAYEIYDCFGNLILKGYTESVNCKKLEKGDYYVNFDNKNQLISKQ